MIHGQEGNAEPATVVTDGHHVSSMPGSPVGMQYDACVRHPKSVERSGAVASEPKVSCGPTAGLSCWYWLATGARAFESVKHTYTMSSIRSFGAAGVTIVKPTASQMGLVLAMIAAVPAVDAMCRVGLATAECFHGQPAGLEAT